MEPRKTSQPVAAFQGNPVDSKRSAVKVEDQRAELLNKNLSSERNVLDSGLQRLRSQQRKYEGHDIGSASPLLQMVPPAKEKSATVSPDPSHLDTRQRSKRYPIAVQDLLRKLQANTSSFGDEKLEVIESIEPQDLQGHGLVTIFGGSKDPQEPTNFSPAEIKDIRMEVMKAIGTCPTLKKIILPGWCSQEPLVTFEELKALLEMLQGSCVIQELSVILPRGAKAEGCKLIGKFLVSNRSLEKFAAYFPSVEKLKHDIINHVIKPLESKGHPNLKVLELTVDEDCWLGVDNVSNILKKCPKLQEMPGVTWNCTDRASATSWAEILVRHDAFNAIHIKGEARHIAIFLSMALLSKQDNGRQDKTMRSLKKLVIMLQSRDEESDVTISEFVQSSLLSAVLHNRNLEVLYLYQVHLYSEEWQKLFKSLRENCTLKELDLRYVNFSDTEGFDDGAWRELQDLVRTSAMLKSLSIVHSLYKEISPTNLVGLCKALESTRSVKALRLDALKMDKDAEQALAKYIEGNKFLEELSLRNCDVENLEDLFLSLRTNTKLQELDLENCSGLNDEAFKALMSALQVNTSIQKIELDRTSWQKEGKGALVRNELLQMERRERYMKVMRENWGADVKVEDLTKSKYGRLFLCGSPKAGKTTLMRSLTGLQRNWISNLATSFVEKFGRTEGVEIQLLTTIDGVQIIIWDLAGQEIFRALQGFLFPKLKLGSIFVFIFSPYDREKKTFKFHEQLKQEMRPWLRFIASNSKITGDILPRVKVLISHMDKLPEDMKGLQWAESVVRVLAEEYKDLLDIDHKLVMSASKKDESSTRTVLNYIKDSFKDLLRNNLFDVPKAYAKLSNNLCLESPTARTQQERKPILNLNEFYALCKQQEPLLREFDSGDEDRTTLLNAIANFLHDTGTIMHFPRSKLVVVDPNWLTCEFLGRLIAAGHEVQTPLIKFDWIENRDDGLISAADFRKYLQKLSAALNSRSSGPCIEVEKLQMLMEEMGICFAVGEGGKETHQYFAPTLFPEEGNCFDGQCQLTWSNVKHGNPDSREIYFYLGLRVECGDVERTNLTPEFFPKFQVYFRNTQIQDREVPESCIKCRYNLITYIHEGYEIHVENDRKVGNYVDVLVRSRKGRNETINYITNHFVEEIRLFCASPNGCPGVQLVVSVLRTDCVERLTQSAYRDEKMAIRKETLKEKWKKYILQQKDWSDDAKAMQYIHVWEAAPKAGLQGFHENANDLLSDDDCNDVRRKVGEYIKAQAGLFQTKQESLEVIEAEIDEELGLNKRIRYYQGSKRASFRSKELKSPQNLSTNPSLSRSETRAKMEELFEELWQRTDRMNHKLDGLGKIMQSVWSSQQQLEESVVRVNSKFDTMVGYSRSEARTKMPRRPYITTEDTNFAHRIKTTVQIGKAVMLHFMCEDRSGNHFIGGQAGLALTVEQKNEDILRLVCKHSIQILWYILRMSLGQEEILPDLEDIDGGGTTLTADAASSLLQLSEKYKRVDIESHEVWSYLKQKLGEDLSKQCAESFNLYRVEYINGHPEDFHAWLCWECKRKRMKENTVRDAA
ncbi:hypothetical protein Mapa_005214 [Marchantia paleacea]|nr:hypothetical protein Mapa_005214 [Marchantia paleacea]